MLKYEVMVFVQTQVLLNESCFFHPQMLGNSSNVRIAKNRGGGFAAIGAIEAIEALKNFLVPLVKPGIQLLVFPVFLQEGFNFFGLGFAFIQGGP